LVMDFPHHFLMKHRYSMYLCSHSSVSTL